MFNPFDDDDATNFVAALVKGKSAKPVSATLDKATKQAKKSWLDNTRLCTEALTAATVVAAARGQAGRIPVPDQLTAWIINTGYTPGDDDAKLAAEIVDVIRTNSMLQEIVDDGGWPGWKQSCSALAKRLRNPAKPVHAPALAAKSPATMSPTAARKALEKKRGDFTTYDGQLGFQCGDENAVTDADLTLLCRIPELQHVSLPKPWATDDGLAQLTALPNLESLNLSETKVTAAGLMNLRPIKTLRELTIRKTATDELLEAVGQIKNLREVDIYYSKKVTDAGLRSLAGLTKLEVLNIGRVNSQGDGLASLSGSKLKSLNVTGMKLTEAAAKAIGGFTSLEHLDLGQCEITSGMLGELTRLKKLRELKLFIAKGLDDSAFGHLSNLTALTNLSCRGMQSLTGKGLGAFTALKRLTELDLSSTGVTGAEVGRLGEVNALLVLPSTLFVGRGAVRQLQLAVHRQHQQ